MDMDQELVKALDVRCAELNTRPAMHLDRVFSVIRRLEEHLQGNRLPDGLAAQLIGELTYYVVLIPIPIPLGQRIKFSRAVRYEESTGITYEALSRLSYIPIGGPITAKLGRLNKVGESKFYACKDDHANSIGAVLSEARARPGEIFNILISETIPPEKVKEPTDNELIITPLGIFDYYRRGVPDPFGLHPAHRKSYEYLVKNSHPEGMLAMQLVDAFISDILKRQETEGLYTLTSVLAAEIDAIPIIDGILYPSTQFDSFPNVALNPSAVDKKLQHTSAIAVRVLERYGYGIFKTEQIAKGTVTNGLLTWEHLRVA
ncbi:MAG: hypothetical protein E6Q78_14565 [Rhodoferax sp.]|nr:MAG: hypothetical protein E6Q78_14565 [Rhodoferax sp.]